MTIKVSDYIVKFLIEKKITDVFGYPGGMITHLMNSFYKYNDEIKAHVNYHEQASSFCACGYAQVKNIPGVAYATSGPGATNLLTGIANAYYDSIPTIFLTGQVNTYESKGELKVRQKGFQETNIVEMVKTITKYAKYVDCAKDIPYELEKAYQISIDKRKGPVLLDIPMDILKTEIEVDRVEKEEKDKINNIEKQDIEIVLKNLLKAKRPVIIAGAGIDLNGYNTKFKELVKKIGIPVVTSMIGVDLQNYDSIYNFGFIGVYGHRYANFLLEKCDLILTLGTRLDCRQIGTNKKMFARHSQIIRVDNDINELENKIHENEIQIVADLKDFIEILLRDDRFALDKMYKEWVDYCITLKKKLEKVDFEEGNMIVEEISKIIEEGTVITTDVGQNQVWVAQSFKVKENQRILFSGGHGAMGYSIPAGIGAYYANKKKVICFCGDGGLQMNIQEFQFIVREKIPIKIIVLNNRALGMIRHFQEMYFDKCYTQTINNTGYSSPDFCKIAEAYGIKSIRLKNFNEQFEEVKHTIENDLPVLIQIEMSDFTYVYPKLKFNEALYNQEPELDKKLLQEILL